MNSSVPKTGGNEPKWVEWSWLAISWAPNVHDAGRSRPPPHVNIRTFSSKLSVMNLKSWHFLCLLFICLSVCQCNKEEEGDLKGTEEEEELVVAAIYKVATQLTRILFDNRYTQMHNNVFNEHITPGKQREAEKAAEADGGHLVEAHGGPLPHHSDSLGQGDPPCLASIHAASASYLYWTGWGSNKANQYHACRYLGQRRRLS